MRSHEEDSSQVAFVPSHSRACDCTLFIMDETPSLVSPMAAGMLRTSCENLVMKMMLSLITLSLKGRFATLQ